MGLVILPVAFAIGLAWLGVTLALSACAWLLFSKLPYGRTIGSIASIAICATSWYLPNRDGLAKQREFDRITTDCGWKVLQVVPDVDGVYAESPDASTNNYRFRALLKHYKTLEYPEQDGRIVHIVRDPTSSEPVKTYIASRTLRYSLSLQSSNSKYFRRAEATVFDTQQGKKLAVDIEYWPNDTSRSVTLVDYAVRTLLVGPNPDFCQSTLVDLNDRIASVLVPSRTVQ